MRDWKKLKILFGVRNDGADAWFRAAGPASVLRYQGYAAECSVPAITDAACFDVLILQRHASPIGELVMRAFQERGKPVIYDVDDWLEGLPPTWPAYGEYFNRGHATPRPSLRFHWRMLRRADMVTCTVPALAEKLAPYNPNVHVVPNCILQGHWDVLLPLEKEFEGPLMGWFGLPYYWDSWKLIAEAVEQAICEVEGHLAVLGFPEVVQAFSPGLAARTFVQPMTRWRDFHEMRRMISSFDVGIAWLEDTAFNRCKSPLKAIQYGAAGVPVVASQVAYSEVLGDEYPEQYGLASSTLEGLYCDLLKSLRGDGSTELRAAAWRERVWSRHSYETQWNRWLDVIKKVVK